ncbi:hypothetical protein DFJ73DRAFT_632233 [Zopfochytrium polystomum]|nr:hypothetical protein DFJ73DRAFT_636000 [Zopfochytrium polystomum]KAI9327197.1 hypothetical protein DFJ73DRAFT_632233 [Zopfochytrium polystomum]
MIRLLYFATAKDAASGRTSEDIAVTDLESANQAPTKDSVPLSHLLQFITARHPDLSSILATAMIAINLEYVDREHLWDENGYRTDGVVVKDGDEVAVIPPVSGG